MQLHVIIVYSTASYIYVLKTQMSLTRKVFDASNFVDNSIYLKCLISLVNSNVHNDNYLFQVGHTKSVNM